MLAPTTGDATGYKLFSVRAGTKTQSRSRWLYMFLSVTQDQPQQAVRRKGV